MNQPINFNQQEALVSGPRKSREYKTEKKCKRRTLKKTTVIRECWINFKLVKDHDDQIVYILKIDKVNGVHIIEKKAENNTKQLPVTSLLEKWKLEVRERRSGPRDRVYYHPGSSKKTYRSLIEVAKFIGDNYYPKSSEKLQVQPQKERVPLDKMRIISANNSFVDESPATPLNEEVQYDEKQGITEDETQVASILAYDLGKYVAFNGKVEPEDL